MVTVSLPYFGTYAPRRLLILVMIDVMATADGCGASGGPSRALPSSNSSSTSPQGVGTVIEMQGALNVRAVAGFQVSGSRWVKPGILYRSSALTYLTEKDLGTLTDLDIRTVIDFRGPQEQAAHPDRLPAGVATINAPVSQDELDFTKIDVLLDRDGFSPQMRDREKVDGFGPFYRMYNLVNSYGEPGFLPKLVAYKSVFDQLLDTHRSGAVLIHCTGGRDRTGIGTAILLRALGVSERAIEDDYLASNVLLQPERDDPNSTYFERFSFSSVYLQPADNRRFRQVAAELAETPQHIYDAVKLRGEYLTTLWASIDAQFGSFDTFLSTQLGMTPQRLSALRNRMTD